MGPIYGNLYTFNWNKYVKANFIWYRIFTSVFGWKYHYLQNNVLITKTNQDWRHISGCNCPHSGAINWLALSSSKYLQYKGSKSQNSMACKQYLQHMSILMSTGTPDLADINCRHIGVVKKNLAKTLCVTTCLLSNQNEDSI